MRAIVRPCASTSLLLTLAIAWPGTLRAQAPLNMEDCVRVATQGSAVIEEVGARVHQFEARLAEIQSLYYPKLSGLAYAAPAPRVTGDGYSRDWQVHWKSLSDWAPHTNLQMLLAQPLYSFGRIEAGVDAMQHRTEVERARVREAANAVALEVRKFYLLRLFSQSMQPPLKQGLAAVHSAQARAAALYEAGTGEVSQIDLSRLDYGAAEAERYLIVAHDAAELALAALRHTMGLPMTAPLELADQALPAIPADPGPAAPTLAALIQRAARGRPEWAQLDHGRQATVALEEAERLANFPVLFAAGQMRWASNYKRPRDANPWHYDDQNTFTGGVAVGLKFDLDPALAEARMGLARAQHEEVEALRRFAATGIPLQVRRAYEALGRSRRIVGIAHKAVVATRKWLTSADQAYSSGTGEARDLLEGLAAHVQAKRTYYEHVQAYFEAQAELVHAVGGSCEGVDCIL